MQFFERRYDELEEVRSERTSQESYAASPTSKALRFKSCSEQPYHMGAAGKLGSEGSSMG